MKFVSLLILLTVANVQAQVHDAATPYTGLGGGGGALFSPWNIFSNQAGISRLKNRHAGISYRTVFDLKELSTKSVFVALPTKWGNYGLTYTHFGYEKYSEQLVGLAFAKRLSDFLDVGGRIDYLFFQVAKQAHCRQAFCVDLGMIFSLPYGINLGVHTFNPGGLAERMLPSQYRVVSDYSVSGSWQIESKFLFVSQLTVSDKEMSFSFGGQYLLLRFLNVRCGFCTQYDNIYAGIGGIWNRWMLDVSYNTHPNLGNSTGMCLMLKF